MSEEPDGDLSNCAFDNEVDGDFKSEGVDFEAEDVVVALGSFGSDGTGGISYSRVIPPALILLKLTPVALCVLDRLCLLRLCKSGSDFLLFSFAGVGNCVWLATVEERVRTMLGVPLDPEKDFWDRSGVPSDTRFGVDSPTDDLTGDFDGRLDGTPDCTLFGAPKDALGDAPIDGPVEALPIIGPLLFLALGVSS